MTRADILKGLKRIGVVPGMRLMVHSSLSSFGRIEGGAGAVIEALIEAVGPGGTLLLPTFNHGKAFEMAGGIYDPATTPTTNGLIPETFRRMPGVGRSLNPTHPYAGWGKDAKRYLARHHETLTMGEDSPLGMLAREGGHQLNLGTTHHASTAKHLAETMRRVPCLGYRTEEYPVRMPDGTVRKMRTWGWRDGRCPLTESGDLIEEEMERSRAQRKITIGECPAVLFKLQEFLEAVWRLLDRGHGDVPPCARCNIRPRKVPQTVESDWND